LRDVGAGESAAHQDVRELAVRGRAGPMEEGATIGRGGLFELARLELDRAELVMGGRILRVGPLRGMNPACAGSTQQRVIGPGAGNARRFRARNPS